MDLGQVFEFGQGYVALSRVRRLSGLHLLGFNERAFKVHPEVLTKDGQFQAESTRAGQALAKILPRDIQKTSQQFIAACGGSAPRRAPASGLPSTALWEAGPDIGFKKVRVKHPNAYLPWDKEQDIELQELFEKELSIGELATAFNRTRGAITSRLKKLGILES